MENEKKYLTLNMCDFCSNEVETCGAAPIYSKDVKLTVCAVEPINAVIACDKYKSPVDVLKKQFH